MTDWKLRLGIVCPWYCGCDRMCLHLFVLSFFNNKKDLNLCDIMSAFLLNHATLHLKQNNPDLKKKVRIDPHKSRTGPT